MPITRFGLLPGRSLDFGKITECKSVLQWLGVSNSNQDTDQIVYQQAVGAPWSLPIIPYVSFNPFVTFPPQLCRGISVKQDSSAPRKWVLEANYSSEPLKGSDEQQAENPLDRPPAIKWSSKSYQLAIAYDRNGKAILNSAGDFFDPPVEVERSHWTVSISKNVLAVPQSILEYANATNQSAFAIQGVGIAAECAKLMDIGLSERQSEGEGQNKVSFYTFDYTMELRAETWKLKTLDQGVRYKDGSDIKQILDDHSPPRPVTSPKCLDGAGGILANPTPQNAKFLEFDVEDVKDFTILPGLLEAAT